MTEERCEECGHVHRHEYYCDVVYDEHGHECDCTACPRCGAPYQWSDDLGGWHHRCTNAQETVDEVRDRLGVGGASPLAPMPQWWHGLGNERW